MYVVVERSATISITCSDSPVSLPNPPTDPRPGDVTSHVTTTSQYLENTTLNPSLSTSSIRQTVSTSMPIAVNGTTTQQAELDATLSDKESNTMPAFKTELDLVSTRKDTITISVSTANAKRSHRDNDVIYIIIGHSSTSNVEVQVQHSSSLSYGSTL